MTEKHFEFEGVSVQANYTKVLAKSYTTLVSVQVSQPAQQRQQPLPRTLIIFVICCL